MVDQATNSGREVVALVRNPSKLGVGAGVEVVSGNVLNVDDVSETVADTDTVICCLGNPGDNPTDVLSRGTERIVTAMERHGVDRLIVLTSMGLGESNRRVPWYVRIAVATVLTELMADKARQEKVVMRSGLDWTVVRPGGLTNGPRTGDYRSGTGADLTAGPISRANVAAFLLDQLEDGSYRYETPVITSDEPIDFGFLREQAISAEKRLSGM